MTTLHQQRHTAIKYKREHFQQLLIGLSGPFGNNPLKGTACLDFMQEAWDRFRNDLLPEWIEDNPGTRPYSWWAFDAPERRRCTNSKRHPHDCPAYVAEIAKIERSGVSAPYGGAAFALSFGIPRLEHGCRKCAMDPKFEFEVEYLHRLNLLTPAEKKLVKAGHEFQFQPAAEQCVEMRPPDRYESERMRKLYNLPRGKLFDNSEAVSQ